jgi:predicted DsbA family dithiol-disulfide isomerase
VEIEMWADAVCPWCYLGKKRLEKALEGYDGDVTVRYRPFQLDPGPVAEPEPLAARMARRFGGPERARQIFANTTRVAAADGVELRFDRAVTANTFDAHRLVWYAGEQGGPERQSAVLDALYRAHFTEGVDLGSRAALAEVAGGAELDAAEVRAFLDSPAGVREVRASLAEARELGISSVPMFVFAGKYGVAGAQDPATLREVLAEVDRRESAAA